MSVDEFRTVYEQHIAHVASGDIKAVLADMVQERVPAVFEGIDAPRGPVHSYTITDVRADGDRMVGETVYDVGDRLIGLRSFWEDHGGRWLAAALENFTVDAHAGRDA
ncbi:hypothetical protein O6072_22335 [Mycolicibacterium neoaurum]|uniref:hypothetical protein n=1 Tax=Mycolicibacterium neoaurum TaxID=1795 RepID=UPI00248CDEB0|nr:hypothetical protein [Mycolicibacterium neoaurum]MDO3402970.1 hypothetical protein [Mycolicibacterium neoaurum]WBP93678.1 hypothetical protein O7W24_21455 [Mycolicibacterium neoaurum]WBS07545.1 hypothetical protein O6072_22335 [Mycolicibacterium neoaurum]